MANPARRCVALLSGGLDSLLAARFMRDQAVAVEAVYFRTWFADASERARVAADLLEVPLTVIELEEEYVAQVKRPRFGWGPGVSPCLDCRIQMFRRAKQWLEQTQADFLVSGEVLGQRGWSQKRRDLRTIAHHGEVEAILLRPLSALLLPPTRPEREGWVDRTRLGNCVGQSRKRQLAYARRWGITYQPAPSRGCALVKPHYAERLVELLARTDLPSKWECDLLDIGRHLKFDDQTRVILGRDQLENEQLREAHRHTAAVSTALLWPENFTGPSALVLGPLRRDTLHFAITRLLQFSPRADVKRSWFRLELARSSTSVVLAPHSALFPQPMGQP
jgi:tRNA-specific 2-thiouridylase